MRTVNFSHLFWKLRAPCFTTIRKRNFGVRIGQLVKVALNHTYLCYAEVINVISCKIIDIPLKILKKDGEGLRTTNNGMRTGKPITITSHRDFATLMNSFPNHEHYTVDSHVTLVVLKVRPEFEEVRE